MAIDMNKLREHKTTGSPFMEFKAPDGDTFYAYALTAVENARVVENKTYNRMEKHCRFKVIGLAPEGAAIARTRSRPDEFVEVDKVYVVNVTRHAVLARSFEEFGELDGRTFHVMNRGKVMGKKNAYQDYAVMEMVGEMFVEFDIDEDSDPDDAKYAINITVAKTAGAI